MEATQEATQIENQKPASKFMEDFKAFLKKMASISVMLIILCGVAAWYLHGKLDEFINSDGKGGAITLYKRFFQDIDDFNKMIMAIVFTVCVFLFIGFDIFYSWLFKLISKKSIKLHFFSWHYVMLIPRIALAIGSIILVFAIGANYYIISSGSDQTLKSVKQVQDSIRNPIPALVLGTSKHFQGGPNKGKENKYFTYRMAAAKELWEAGKVSEFVVSGDKTGQYDETRDMKEDLIAIGVPVSKVKTDTSGLRTMDSMLRMRNVFGIEECFIVSQDFHVWRALFQAYYYGMKGRGYYAGGTSTWKMILRECQARPKAVLDLYIFNMVPQDKLEDRQHHEEFVMDSNQSLVLVLSVLIGVACAIAAWTKYAG